MTTVPRDQTLVYRPVTTADEPAVLDLLRDALGSGPNGERSADFLHWKHRDNPFGPSPSMVAEDAGRLVGVRLLMRWELQTGDRVVRAFRAVDTATDPDYRGRGIFRELTLRLLAELDGAAAADLVFNTPNQSSRPGYLKMGWRPVGTLPVLITPVRPLRFLAGVRSARRSTAMTEQTGDAAGGLARSPLPPCPLPTAAEILARHGDEIASLLSRAEVPEGLHTRRTVPFLVWRYGQAPGLDYRCLTLESSRGELRGVAFGRLRHRGSLAELTLSDLLVAGGDGGAARRLLRAARRSGADHVAVHAPHGSSLWRAARLSGYLPVPRYGLGLVANPRRELPLDPFDVRAWSLTLGDLEVF